MELQKYWFLVRNHFAACWLVRVIALTCGVLDIAFDLEVALLQPKGMEDLLALSHIDLALAFLFVIAPANWLRGLNAERPLRSIGAWIVRIAFLLLGLLVTIEYTNAYLLTGGTMAFYSKPSDAQALLGLGMSMGVVVGWIVVLWVITVTATSLSPEV